MTIFLFDWSGVRLDTLQGPLHVFTRIPQSNQSGFGIADF
jgi:hypothetical protein